MGMAPDHLADLKRDDNMALPIVQRGNAAWWTEHPMTYDWHGELALPFRSPEWFDAIDARFIAGAQYFATRIRPFDRILPLADMAGKRVLEIGCGMGLHSETMIRAGAEVTAIDLSPTSVETTTERLRLKGLSGTVQQADAEALPFEDRAFDFVWSWGVIHHSSRTAKIVREIARVLTPDGTTKVMVYNRDGMAAQIAFWKDHIAKLGFLHRSYDETLYRTTDGFSARYYTRDQFEDLFAAHFDVVSSHIMGLEADAIPLPRKLRALARKVIPDEYVRRAQATRGAFLFLTASRPS